MKNFLLFVSLFLASTAVLTGCEVVGDIFKAGVWTGVVLVVGAVGIIIWIVSKSMS